MCHLAATVLLRVRLLRAPAFQHRWVLGALASSCHNIVPDLFEAGSPLLQGLVSCLHYSGRKSVSLIRINGHLVQCRPLVHSLEALYTQHARSKPFVFLVSSYLTLLFWGERHARSPAPCCDHPPFCSSTYLPSPRQT